MLEQTTRGIAVDCELKKYVFDCEECGFCEGERKMKYIIELDEIPNTGLYKARGANTLVFDKKGIKNILKPYKEESEVDWSQVAVDTPILVKTEERARWHKRYFSKYDVVNNVVYAWNDGCTSWTSNGVSRAWDYAKLAEDKMDNLSKVKDDTSILMTAWGYDKLREAGDE